MNDMKGTVGDVSARRLQGAVQDRVAQAMTDDSSVQREVTNLVSASPDTQTLLSALVTDEVKNAAMKGAADGGPQAAADAVSQALGRSDPASLNAAGQAIAQTVTGHAGQIADAMIGGSGQQLPADNQAANPFIQVKLTDKSGRTFTPKYHFAKGSVVLVLDPDREFTPGIYTLDVTVTNPLTGEAQTLSQNFAWGVLAMNTNQDTYVAGQTGSLAIGVLDDGGNIVCDAQLKLTVTAPSGAMTEYDTAPQGGGLLGQLLNNPNVISKTGTCGLKNSTNVSRTTP